MSMSAAAAAHAEGPNPWAAVYLIDPAVLDHDALLKRAAEAVRLRDCLPGYVGQLAAHLVTWGRAAGLGEEDIRAGARIACRELGDSLAEVMEDRDGGSELSNALALLIIVSTMIWDRDAGAVVTRMFLQAVDEAIRYTAERCAATRPTMIPNMGP